MFESLLRNPLELTIKDRVLVFDSAEDLEFALRGRSDVPGSHVAELMRMTDEDLHAEAARLHGEERFLAEHFGEVLADLPRFDERFGAFQTSFFRADHDWREIMSALVVSGAQFVALKRTALTCYLEYLNGRARFVHDVIDRRLEKAVTIAQPRPEERVTQLGANVDDGEPDAPERPFRLPQGEPTLVLTMNDQRVSLRFAAHPVTISRLDQIRLRHGDTDSWCLPVGRSVVGRDTSCDIMMHQLMKDISRIHAMIDVDIRGEIWVTDVSTHGTFLMTAERGEEQ